MFFLIVTVNTIGEYIENNPEYYSCPNYCMVEHKHINQEKEINSNEYTKDDSTAHLQQRD